MFWYSKENTIKNQVVIDIDGNGKCQDDFFFSTMVPFKNNETKITFFKDEAVINTDLKNELVNLILNIIPDNGLNSFVIENKNTFIINFHLPFTKTDLLPCETTYIDFGVQNFKISSHPYRTTTLDLTQMISNLYYSSNIKFIEHESKHEINKNWEAYLKIVAFNHPQLQVDRATTDMSTFTNLLIEHSQCLKLSKSLGKRETKNIRGSNNIINDSHFEGKLNEFCLLLKPNAYYHMPEFFRLMGNFKVTHMILVPSKPEYLEYFYPNCIKKPYGLDWFNYLKENWLILIKFKTCMNVEQIHNVKMKWREQSGEQWTRNVCHGPENSSERDHLENFFKYLTDINIQKLVNVNINFETSRDKFVKKYF